MARRVECEGDEAMNDHERLWTGIVNGLGFTLAIIIAAWALAHYL